MKNVFKISMVIPLLGITLFACQPLDYKEVGVPVKNIAALAGTWKLSKVTQTDEDAARKGFPFTTLDLTSVFPYTDFRLTLNTNGNTPTTFATTPGNAPKVIRLLNGNWTADDPTYPKVLTLVNGTDTSRVTLGSYPTGSNSALKLRQERRDATTGRLLISYNYEFTKQ
jgi:hypothetical protein